MSSRLSHLRRFQEKIEIFKNGLCFVVLEFDKSKFNQ